MALLPVATEARSAGRPGIQYFFVNEDEIEDKKSKIRKQAKLCVSLEEKCFEGEDARIGPLSRMFVCISCDVTDTEPADNPFFNNLRAPIVLIVGSDGSVAGMLDGGNAKRQKVFSTMASVLKGDGVDSAKTVAKIKKALGEIRDLEDEKEDLESETKDLRGDMLDAKEGSSRMVKLEHKLEAQRALVDKKERALEAAYAVFDAAVAFPDKKGRRIQQ